MEKLEKKFWIVVRASFPNYVENACQSYAEAFDQCKDLAVRMPGTKFVIMESVESVQMNSMVIARHVDIPVEDDILF